ncbi:hypothetical protein D3C80_1655900 [compost metagenome]
MGIVGRDGQCARVDAAFGPSHGDLVVAAAIAVFDGIARVDLQAAAARVAAVERLDQPGDLITMDQAGDLYRAVRCRAAVIGFLVCDGGKGQRTRRDAQAVAGKTNGVVGVRQRALLNRIAAHILASVPPQAAGQRISIDQA